MAIAKLKRPTEERLEERADKMAPEDRARADAATKKIADRVRRRTLRG
jgi:hypothetical protein